MEILLAENSSKDLALNGVSVYEVMEQIDNRQEQVAKPDEVPRDSAANDGLSSKCVTAF